MKKTLAILFVLIISQIIFAQTAAYKVAEYQEVGHGCDESGWMYGYLLKLKENEKNRALIVVYFDSTSNEKFGNVAAFASGMKKYLAHWLRFNEDKISVVISEGKKTFAREFWIIPENAEMPKINPFSFDWRGLKEKYYFSHTYYIYEPDNFLLTDFQPNYEDFAKILKQFPNYKGQIVVNNYWELSIVKENLTVNQQLSRNRYSIQIRKKKRGDKNDYPVDLYLIPTKKEKSLAEASR